MKLFSGRTRVNRKIFRFAISVGALGPLLTATAYIASSYPSVARCRANNLQALSEISCKGATCDTRTFLTDFGWDGPDYVVDTETGYFLNTATPTEGDQGRFTPLDFSDPTFLARFRQPTSYETPEGEIWRLYSAAVLMDSKKGVEVMVGYQLKAPSEPLATPASSLGDVDAAIKAEADRVGRALLAHRSGARPSRNGFQGGFQVVDPNTKQVLEQGPWLPAFLPKGMPLPAPGLRLYAYEGSLYVVRTDTQGRLLATSLTEIGQVWWMLCWCGVGFLLASPTFAVRLLFAPRPNYIWFVCNNDPGENAEKGLSEDLPSFLAAGFLAFCC
ncbi:MAG: hypothetical protein ACLQVN_00140, partial [Bryobacteraceae bacterium]